MINQQSVSYLVLFSSSVTNLNMNSAFLLDPVSLHKTEKNDLIKASDKNISNQTKPVTVWTFSTYTSSHLYWLHFSYK